MKNFKKRVLSAVMAACMLFGSAALLPKNELVQQTGINAAAETWNGFEYKVVGSKITLTAYNGKKKDITVPKTINGMDVRMIEQGVFEGNKTIENVVIECDLGYIIHYMFKDCTSLKSVRFTGSCNYAYHNVFENCTNLESVKLPDDLLGLNSDFFKGCYKLADIQMSKDINSVSVNNFADTKWLADMKKKNPLVVYGNLLIDAREYRAANYTIPSNIKYIAGNAFEGNRYLKSIVVPDTVEKLGGSVFRECVNLEKAVINVKQELYNTLFYNCTKLSDVTIGEGVERLWNYIFMYCRSLKKIKLPSTVKDIGFECFSDCTALEEVYIPYGLEKIGYHCFYNCTNLKKLWIPDTVKRIDEKAFYNCFPDPLIIPAGVEKIEEKAFGYRGSTAETDYTLRGYKGSLAEKYAKENGIKFKAITKCPHVEGEKKKVAATCTEDGYNGTRCRICNKLISGKEYKALGHKWNETVYEWPNYGNWCIASRVCSRDNSHFEKEYASIASKKKSESTCSQRGVTTYTATFMNPDFKTQVKDFADQPLKEHKWSDWKTTAFDLAAKTSAQTRKCSACSRTENHTTHNALNRLAGANRYETASVISSKMFGKTDTVIIATGMSFHDAMAAVPLASAYNAPLLLATEKHITAQTEAELKRLGAKNVIVVSTNGAIGEKAKAEFKAAKYNMTYIEGKTCFETAAKVAKALQEKTKKAPTTIFFATDSAFADALSASPVAAIKGAPILYLKNTGSIDAATANYLKSVKGKVKNAYIIGGDGVISDAMMKKAASALGLTVNKTVVRVAGKNRYETGAAVNKKFKSVLTGDGICVAKGLDFPDALAGGVYAAATKQALFLADGKKLLDCQSTYLKGKNAAKITVFGGTGAVTDELVKLIAQASVLA